MYCYFVQNQQRDEQENMDIKPDIKPDVKVEAPAEDNTEAEKQKTEGPSAVNQRGVVIPLRNAVCGHYYDEQSLLQYLKDSGLKARYEN